MCRVCLRVRVRVRMRACVRAEGYEALTGAILSFFLSSSPLSFFAPDSKGLKTASPFLPSQVPPTSQPHIK